MHDFDAITLEQLQSSGGLKWETFPGTIGAFVAEADFGTAPAVKNALRRAVEEDRFGYLPPSLARGLGEACARWQSENYGWEVRPERVHPIADVVRGLELAIEHFSRPGSAVILPTPAYMPFLEVPIAAGREIIQVPMLVEAGRYELDLAGIDAAFAAGGGLLVLCNPYNPVGRVFSRGELLAVSEVVSLHGGRVFSDEIHSPLVYPGGPAHIPYASVSDAAAGHSVTATSASKAWNLPGLKCAQFILTNDADAAVWAPVEHAATHGASTLGVIANTAAYTAGKPWLDELVSYLDGNRRVLGSLLSSLLPEVGYRMPEGTYIAWLDFRALGLGDHPARFLRGQAAVALTDGPDCGAPGAGFARLVFATPRPVLEQAVRRMADALASR